MPIAELPGCQTLLLRREGWRLHVTLNRPAARNAMSFAMVGELRDLFIAIARRPLAARGDPSRRGGQLLRRR
jgi:enoyl-CoA hydratase/carnithine racemase